jgi:hypothetical protein
MAPIPMSRHSGLHTASLSEHSWNSFSETGEEAELKRLGRKAPNLDAYVERWVQSVQQECLDHLVAFGERHPRYLIGSTSSTSTR